MPGAQVHRIIDQAADLGYRGKVKLHRLSEGLLDNRYAKFARHINKRGMLLVDDTNGDVLRKNDGLCAELDGVVHEFRIGLYDYRNEEEREEEKSFWMERFTRTRVSFSLPREACVVRQGSGIYPSAPKNADELEQLCYQPFFFFLIRYDGEVSLCCDDDQCNFGLGNVFSQSLEEIWWSPGRLAIAEDLSVPGGRRKYGLCRQCFFSQAPLDIFG